MVIDYGFFGRGGEDVLPILCVKCRTCLTGCLGATVVDRKGASDYANHFFSAWRTRTKKVIEITFATGHTEKKKLIQITF